MADKDPAKLTLEALSPAYREIADIIGLAAYIKLAKAINGDAVYIPKYDSLFDGQARLERDQAIIEKYKAGKSIAELAQEYNLAARTIYNIIPRSLRALQRSGPIEGQMTIDDYAV